MLTTSYQAATVFPRAHQDTGGGMDTHAHFVAPDLSELLVRPTIGSRAHRNPRSAC